jgi:hypothetical protein
MPVLSTVYSQKSVQATELHQWSLGIMLFIMLNSVDGISTITLMSDQTPR